MFDTVYAQTRSDTVKADLIQAEGEAAIARELLTELIGIRDFALMDIAEGVMLTARMASPEQAVAEALQNSPAVAAAKDSADAAEFGIKREKGSWWPEVSLVFNHQYSDVGFDNLTSPPRSSNTFAREPAQSSSILPLCTVKSGFVQTNFFEICFSKIFL